MIWRLPLPTFSRIYMTLVATVYFVFCPLLFLLLFFLSSFRSWSLRLIPSMTRSTAHSMNIPCYLRCKATLLQFRIIEVLWIVVIAYQVKCNCNKFSTILIAIPTLIHCISGHSLWNYVLCLVYFCIIAN